jgi:hypothetical protein
VAAAAGGGAGRLFDGLTAAALADETAGGHALADLFAATALALRFFTPEDEALEILAALLTMVLVYGHSQPSPQTAESLRLQAQSSKLKAQRVKKKHKGHVKPVAADSDKIKA